MAPPGNQAATEKTNINLYHAENPVYSPKAPVKRKKYSVSKKKRFSRENDAAARMGRHLARRSSRHLIDSFCSRSYLLPTLHGSLRFFLTKNDLYRAINLFPFAVVSFKFAVSVSERVVPT